MKWMLDLHFERPPKRIHHSEPILLMGSCFTDNIGTALSKVYFTTLANPSGILFDPDSICRHLEFALSGKRVEQRDLIFANEKYQNLDFHSNFSSQNIEDAVESMNAAIDRIAEFLPQARHLIITLGSSFAYRHKASDAWVANCHQFSADSFEKVLLSTDYMVGRLSAVFEELKKRFPELQCILTVSPVRHIRDGVVANNRSKGRLIETVHLLEEQLKGVYYFPAFEFIIDVLRDYRWYDVDLVHPNYAATQAVFEQFCACCLDDWTQEQLKDLYQLRSAMEHRPRFPDTESHRKFLENRTLRQLELLEKMPWIKF